MVVKLKLCFQDPFLELDIYVKNVFILNQFIIMSLFEIYIYMDLNMHLKQRSILYRKLSTKSNPYSSRFIIFQFHSAVNKIPISLQGCHNLWYLGICFSLVLAKGSHVTSEAERREKIAILESVSSKWQNGPIINNRLVLDMPTALVAIHSRQVIYETSLLEIYSSYNMNLISVSFPTK